MYRKKNIFRNPVFNVIATVLLVAALAVFYKFALSDYGENIKGNLETIDTERLNQIVEVPKTAEDALEAIGKADSVRAIDISLIEYCHDNIRDDIYDRISEYMETNNYSDTMWEELCGYTLKALYDLAGEYTEDYNYIEVNDLEDSLTLAFAGDVNLDSTT